MGGDNLLIVYDKNMRKIGVLENAFSASVSRRANELWTASFSNKKKESSA